MKPISMITLVALLALLSCSERHTAPIRTSLSHYTIEQFYKNKQIAGGTFSPDDTRLLVSSNESGIFNLYENSLVDGKQTQVTSSTVESFFAIDYVPATGDILYTADK